MTQRSRRMRVSKSRVLTCDFGASQNLRFFSASTGYADTRPQWKQWLNPDYAMSRYNAQSKLTNATLSMYAGYGYEEIVGETGSNRFKPVLHRKTQAVCLPMLIMYRRYDNAHIIWEYLRTGLSGSVVIPSMDTFSDTAKVMYPGSDQGFSARAYWSMRPKFRGQVSIINSIFELKDFKDILSLRKIGISFTDLLSKGSIDRSQRLYKQLANHHGIRASMHKHGIPNYADITPGTLKLLARDVSGSAANALLTLNLAIKPTIADALAIAANCAKSALDAQNEFAKYGALGSTSHYSERMFDHTSTKGSGTTVFFNTGSSTEVKRTATAYSTYNYVPRSKNEALAYYWGLTGSVEALWNMLPLSFVLDYVYTVGKALKSMDRDKNVQNLTIDYCESVKFKKQIGLMVRQDRDVEMLIIDGKSINSSSFNLLLVTGGVHTRYHRSPVIPYCGPALPVFKAPKSSQMANMAALARLFI